MKHRYSLDGYAFRLRPIKISDAQFIIDTRLEDENRNKYIHTISRDITKQEKWIEDYFNRAGDYYFIIENRLTGEKEGLISIYDVKDKKAEWGRWVVKKGSLASIESVYLIYRVAFEQVGLDELYCRTIADNKSVVSFHTSIGEKTRSIHKNLFELNGQLYDAVEQYSDRNNFYSEIAPKLEMQSYNILQRELKKEFSRFEFHHIGVATKSIKKELSAYTLLGYKPQCEEFVDEKQGIRGLFIESKSAPCLELLENLDNSKTLDMYLKNNNKMYHMAYFVEDIEKAIRILELNKAKIVSPLKESVYFKKRICFLMLANMSLIELLEK